MSYRVSCSRMLDKSSDRMPEYVLDNMSDRMSDRRSENTSEYNVSHIELQEILYVRM